MSSLSGLSAEELRAAVRSVLREVLPDAGAAPTSTAGPATDVVIASDADLTAFVRRVAALCEDPARRAALQDGRHEFRLGRGGLEDRKLAPQPPNGVRAPQPSTTLRIERGAVTERTVQRAAADGVRLVLGRRAVMTPLARDKARSLGVEIEKEA